MVINDVTLVNWTCNCSVIHERRLVNLYGIFYHSDARRTNNMTGMAVRPVLVDMP